MAASLRIRYDCSLLCLADPSQYTESGPEASRIAISLSPISSMAWSQEMRSHLPFTSLVGYFRRRSPWPCSRTEAPLAQCAPRLNGWSKAGSWPVHTPFCTSAMMPQPTEQCVQTVLTVFTAALDSAARAFFIIAGLTVVANAAPPAARPELRRNARRFMPTPPDREAVPSRTAGSTTWEESFRSFMGFLLESDRRAIS